jgi:UDP-2-acetamido-2-deoxy-ribo-hexuluronate aminotransferase
MEMIDLKRQQRGMSDRLQLRISRVLEEGSFILGPEVGELEAKLSEFAGVKHCVSCANGTEALFLSLKALGIGPGDEVITPGFSYIASASMIAAIGATPVFVDIDTSDFNLDASQLASVVTERTRAILAVSLFGQCADFNAILEVADRFQLPVIEDAAQSFGAEYKESRSCGIARISTTSFFPTKPLGCYGDGGAIFTNDDELELSVRRLARHGQTARYQHEEIGYNSRLDTIQAAVLLCKLEVFESELSSRQKIADAYTEALKGISGIILPTVKIGRKSSWAQYTIRVEGRDQVAERMRSLGVPTAVHYPKPLYDQTALVRYKRQKLDGVEEAARTVLSLPFSPYLEEAEVEQVSVALRRCL